jgi:hypothetical protein
MNRLTHQVSDKLKMHFDRMTDALITPPEGVKWLLPIKSETETRAVSNAFLDKFFADKNVRTLVLGINPGRFGAGITNVAFTDPVHLEKHCGIQNSFLKKEELSAQFVYRVIQAMGGTEKFYRKFFINSVVPFGFIINGKNYNYYDSRKLADAVTPIVIKHIRGLLASGMSNECCICLGEGKNFDFLDKLNLSEGFFRTIVPLPHPRFIMQYRRPEVETFIRQYKDTFDQVALLQ